eukprot:TRINITY_DN90634_c0_g1_i1.p1 TRINITY_DN90634_c0_g1~~TRINITY_DN90634_c0_g1_i1.p1  ORF type:complete len:170 (-),score=10.76 TRINITY_DN90634_c0_g1_i1:153-602(-)
MVCSRRKRWGLPAVVLAASALFGCCRCEDAEQRADNREPLLLDRLAPAARQLGRSGAGGESAPAPSVDVSTATKPPPEGPGRQFGAATLSFAVAVWCCATFGCTCVGNCYLSRKARALKVRAASDSPTGSGDDSRNIVSFGKENGEVLE